MGTFQKQLDRCLQALIVACSEPSKIGCYCPNDLLVSHLLVGYGGVSLKDNKINGHFAVAGKTVQCHPNAFGEQNFWLDYDY